LNLIKVIDLFKKIAVLATIIFMVFGLFAYADSPALRVSSTGGAVGQTVDITVSINGNPGIAMFSLKMEYDKSSVTPISIEKGAALAVGEIISNLQISEATDLDYITAFWYNAADITADGALFTVKFRINDSAAGRIPVNVSYNAGDICNQDTEDVFIDIFGGGIDVIQARSENRPPISQGGNGGGASVVIPQQNEVREPEAGNERFDVAPDFTDIDGYPWAANEIMTLASKGIIKGTSATTFSPANNIKRADYMILLVRMLGLTADFTDNFDDVPQDAYYYREIGSAKGLGLTTGVGDNKFNPEAEITRQDMFVLAYRILIQQGAIEPAGIEVLKQFNDNTFIADYAKEALATLAKSELVKGNENNINPLGLATRAETAVFIYQFIGKD